MVPRRNRRIVTRRGGRREGEAQSARTICAATSALGFSDRQLAKLGGSCEDDVRARRHAPASARSTRASTPAPPSSSRTRRTSTRRTRRERVAADRGAEEGRHPRRRTEPHRPGHRVRLLLRARRAGAARARATRPSWSTATRRRSRPTTTRATGSTSSRSRSRTCSQSATKRSPMGVIVQFGGQTPLKLAVPLEQRGRASSSGRAADAIDRAEDRGRFDELLTKLALKRPRERHRARRPRRRSRVAERIGYPVLVRPSYVLGGRAMMIAYYARRARRRTSRARGRGGARRGDADDPRRRVPRRTRSRSTSIASPTAGAPRSAA